MSKALTSLPSKKIFWPRSVMTSLLTLMLASPLTWAKSETPATDYLKTQVAAVLALTATAIPTVKEKTKIDGELLKLIQPMMDFPAMSEASLGKHWPTLNKAQRDLFMSLFQELVFHSYMKKIRSANKEAKIEYEDETKREQGGAEVEAIAITKKMEVELRFILRPGAKQKGEALYVAEDVVIDEVSLVNNYREEFNKIIATEGFDGLIAKMKKQVQKVK